MKLNGILLKSDNALAAEEAGRYPASVIGKSLGVPAAAITALAPHDGEWHHTGKYANEVRYFSLAECEEFFSDKHGAALLENWKREKKARRATLIIYAGVEVVWREFSGSFKHPTCYEYRDDNAAIIWEGGTMAQIALADGRILRKKLAGNHLEFPQHSAIKALAEAR